MKIKVLCVEDSKVVHSYLKKCLGTLMESFESAYDGQQAIDMLAGDLNRFDVIFLDWDMPVKDGPTTFAELKEKGLTTPVIMLTAHTDMEDMAKMVKAGVNDYIMKPFTDDVIHSKLELVLGF